MVNFNLSSKLIFISFLLFLGALLIPVAARAGTTCNNINTSDGNCGGDFCLLQCAEGAGCSLGGRATCMPWQKCTGFIQYESTNGGMFSYCTFTGSPCCGSCIQPPENPRYYDSPDYPVNLFNPKESISPENVSLPVKLDWDNVVGWKDGWIDEEAKTCFRECKSSPEMCATQCSKTCLSEYNQRGELIKKGVCEERCQEIGKEPSVCLNCGGACDKEPTPRTCKYPTGAPIYCRAGTWRSECIAGCPERCKNTVNFYEIRIEGELRDPDAISEIEENQKKIMEDPENAAEYEEEIKRIREEDLEISEYRTFLDESGFIPSSCLLKSGRSYNWQIRACCDKDGEECGSDTITSSLALAYGGAPISKGGCGAWSEWWSFNTAISPELVSPYDPDWAGPEGGKDIPASISTPVVLDWCDVEEATAYEFRVYLLENGEEICHPWLKSTGTCEPMALKKTLRPEPYPSGLFLYSDFPDEKKGYFTKDTEYLWEIATCVGEFAGECSNFGQKWKFKTTATALATYLIWPPNDPTGQNLVGLPLILDWKDKPGINSYWYEVTPVSGGKIIEGNTEFSGSPPLDYSLTNGLYLDTSYSWRVWACWDYDAEKCEENFLDERYFKTTGAPPQLYYPSSGANDIPIPVNFDWQDMGGAKSYILKISGDDLAEEIVVDNKSELSLDFPEFNIRQEKTYIWQVKTCAWEKGEGACGDYSSPQTFTTFRLPAPSEPSPENNGLLFTNNKLISWGGVEGAKAYQYQIKYLSVSEKEKDQACPGLTGKNLFESPQAISLNSAYVDLKCLGDYQWQAQACLDTNCQEVGKWSSWNLTLVEPGEVGKNGTGGGLVPCGQAYDNPNTPWNERESCQIKHVFLLIKMVIDFVFTRAIPVALVLLTLGTGVMFYLSLGGRTIPLIRIKRMWKWAIMGLFLTFFAWTLVNLILKLVGFPIGVFGDWYNF